MKNKKMNPATNKPQPSRPEERSDKNFGSKQSLTSDLSQTKKAQSPSSESSTAVKSKNNK
jgi:hypothetical protein